MTQLKNQICQQKYTEYFSRRQNLSRPLLRFVYFTDIIQCYAAIFFIFIKSIYKPHDRVKVTFTFSVPSTFPALLSLCSQTVMEVNTVHYVQGRLHPSGICAGEG